MDLGLNHKVFIVTGGSSGIGQAICKSLLAENALPCVLDRDPPRFDHSDFYPCELTDMQQLISTVEKIRAKHKRIDGLINNAGVNDGVSSLATVASFQSSLEKNLIHAFALVAACRSSLIESGGCILNIGSKCATTGQGKTSGYVAAKGALHALTREWAAEFASEGVRVNAVIPAEVMTPMYAKWLQSRPSPEEAKQKIECSIPLGKRMTTPEEIADTVVFLCSERSTHTTGQLIYVDGGYTHLDRALTV